MTWIVAICFSDPQFETSVCYFILCSNRPLCVPTDRFPARHSGDNGWARYAKATHCSEGHFLCIELPVMYCWGSAAVQFMSNILHSNSLLFINQSIRPHWGCLACGTKAVSLKWSGCEARSCLHWNIEHWTLRYQEFSLAKCEAGMCWLIYSSVKTWKLTHVSLATWVSLAVQVWCWPPVIASPTLFTLRAGLGMLPTHPWSILLMSELPAHRYNYC